MSDAVYPAPPRWGEWFPWLLLLRTFRLAKELPKLILGAAGLLATAAGWRLLCYVFSGAPRLAPTIQRHRPWPWEHPAQGAAGSALSSLGLWSAEPASERATTAASDLAWLLRNPVADTWELLSRPVRSLFTGSLSAAECALLLSCTVWAALVWGLCGGAICRIAAVQLARSERVGLREAWSYARARWSEYLWAPLMPVIVVFLLAMLVSAGSWLLRFDAGLLVAAVAWPLWLAAGLVMALVGLGLLAGWPLLTACVSCESTDSFDAVSRAFAYVYQRPLHYAAYSVLAVLYGMLGWLLVGTMAAACVYLAWWGASFAAGEARTARLAAQVPPAAVMVAWPHEALAAATTTAPPNGAEAGSSQGGSGANSPRTGTAKPLSAPGRWGLRLLTFWLLAVKQLALGFGPAYFWTACTAVYLLLRYDTDRTELDEVWMPAPTAALALPGLVRDAAGVPDTAEAEDGGVTESALAMTSTTTMAAPAREAVSNDELDLTESRAEYDGG